MSGNHRAPGPADGPTAAPDTVEPTALQAADLCIGGGGGSTPGWQVELPRFHSAAGGPAAALVGPSGCGKSSLLRVLAGHQPPPGLEVLGGRVTQDGEPLPSPGTPVARARLSGPVTWLPQDAPGVLDPLRRLGPQLADLAGPGVDALVGFAERLGIRGPNEALRRYPYEVSGGEAQRWLLAAGLARYADGRSGLLVVDEPTAHVDGDTARAVLALLKAHSTRPGCGLLVATHDWHAVESLGAQVWRAGPRSGGPGSTFIQEQRPPSPWPDWRKGRSPQEGDAVLAVQSVRVVRGGRHVLRGADLALRPGEIVGLVGASGAGKTTLAMVLAALLKPDDGAVHGPPRASRGPHPVQLLFQNARSSLTPRRKIRGLLREGMTPAFDLPGTMANLGLGEELLHRTAATLSGGEARRVALLRALAADPQVIILDEPTAGLDREAAVQMTELLLRLQREHGCAILAITHDRGWADAVADRVLTMADGKVLE